LYNYHNLVFVIVKHNGDEPPKNYTVDKYMIILSYSIHSATCFG